MAPASPFLLQDVPAAPAPLVNGNGIVYNSRPIDWDYYVRRVAQFSPEARQSFLESIPRAARLLNDPEFTQGLIDHGFMQG